MLPDTDPARRAWLRLALGLAAGGTLRQAGAGNSLGVGAPAPPLVLHAIDGSRIATRDLLGRVVVVAFWASWCDPCRAELPLLSEFARAHRDDGLRVLGFSLDRADAIDAVRKIAATLSFPVGLLGSAYAGAYGRIWRLPVSFVIARDGRLADDGWTDAAPEWTRERLARVLLPLLRDSG